MQRTLWLTCALLALAGPAAAQSDAEVLLEDLRASIARGGHDADVAATEVQRLAKSLDRPEALLPLAEQLLASRNGTAEYGLVGAGYTALSFIVERSQDPREVLPALERAMFEHRDAHVREWITSSLVRLARRAPEACADLARKAITHPDGGVREVAGKLFQGPFSAKGEAFGPARAGAAGEVVKGFLPDVVAREVFKTVQQAAVSQAEAEGQPARAQALRATRVEFLETNAIQAELQGQTVRVSYGLLHEVYARSMQLLEAGKVSAGERGIYQARALGLVFAHELAHAQGLKAERPADAQAVRTVWSSMLAPQTRAQADVLLESTLALFEQPTGSSAFSNLLYRIRAFLRYGAPGGRLSALRRAAAGEPDPLQRFRRADGTLKWAELGAEHAKTEAAGLMKFGLALFLKELAVVARTGDRARIEEFFDGLLTTDFYAQYGMFVVGARAGEVAYAKYLQRYVRPRFVSGVLKTNLALATGLALPLLVNGEFDGQAFAISFGALGLSSAAVKLGVQGLRWVTPVREARASGLLTRLGPGAGRVARLGGWLYTVGELAVVLLLADEVEGRVHEWLDEREAREALGQANAALVEVARRPGVDPQALDEALGAARDAWIGWRDFLFRPLQVEELRLAERMGKLARQAKRSEDERQALLQTLERQPALRAWARGQLGSLQAWVDARLAARDEALKGEVDGLLADYDARRAKLLDEAYQGQRRPHALFADRDEEELAWLFGGAAAHGQSGFAGFGRRRSRSQLAEALADEVSASRLQVYEDELRFFSLLAQSLRADGEQALADRLLEARARAVLLQHADQALATNQGGIQQVLESTRGE